MAKALVIKNVNFSANALDQVQLIEDIPCTGISLNHSTLNILSLSPETLVATVTPASTTDAIEWRSSDNTVATVANGVVTPLKSGSVIITAICGTKTATCAVTIRVYLNANFALHYYFQRKTSSSGDAVGLSGGEGTTTYGYSNIAAPQTGSGAYKAYIPSNVEHDPVYPIKMPTGMTGLAFVVPNNSIKISPYWTDSQSESGYSRAALCVSCESDNPWDSSIPAGSRSVNAPGNGEDSFFISVYIPSAAGPMTQEMLDAITVEVLYETV